MKKIFALILFSCFQLSIFNCVAQDYVPGQVIVKLRSTIGSSLSRKAKRVVSEISTLDSVLNEIGASNVEDLSSVVSASNAGRKVKAYNGTTITVPNTNKTYLVDFDGDKSDVMQVAAKLKSLDEVEFAEPNYLVKICDEEEGMEYDDPLYPEQSYFSRINLPALWTAPKLNDKRPVIAILDTGVDTTHPDLVDNIMKKGNGIVGYDFVNESQNIRDNNGHGTHCAGIAAAVAGNGIGIVGANPDAYIMPVTVIQSNGQGDVATIIKGINYAVENGADIINMSFGIYTNSGAFEQALANAYASCILVASAGNDCLPLQNKLCPRCGKNGKPMFPAAYTFVLGVQAADASFSNLDLDGSAKSAFSEYQQYNYELSAPGVDIMSTYPGGGYKKLSGTSMAAPLMAGAISRLLQSKEYTTQEELFGDLLLSASDNLYKFPAAFTDIYSAYQKTDEDRNPVLELLGCEINDEGGNGECNPGETVELFPTLRNAFGNARNIHVSMTRQEGVEAGAATILKDTITVPDISSYAKEKALEGLKIKVSEKCSDGLVIPLTFTVTCDNQAEPLEYEYMLKVNNRVELYGTFPKDTTLYPNVNYYIPHPIRIPSGVTLTIKPGCHFVLSETAKIVCAGNLVCEGTSDNQVVFEADDNYTLGTFTSNQFAVLTSNDGLIQFKYTEFKNLELREMDGMYTKCSVENCFFYGQNNYITSYFDMSKVSYCNFVNNTLLQLVGIGMNNTFVNNSFYLEGYHLSLNGLGAGLNSVSNHLEINVYTTIGVR